MKHQAGLTGRIPSPDGWISGSDDGVAALKAGAWADIVALDRELQAVAVFVEGEAIDLTTN